MLRIGCLIIVLDDAGCILIASNIEYFLELIVSVTLRILD